MEKYTVIFRETTDYSLEVTAESADEAFIIANDLFHKTPDHVGFDKQDDGDYWVQDENANVVAI